MLGPPKYKWSGNTTTRHFISLEPGRTPDRRPSSLTKFRKPRSETGLFPVFIPRLLTVNFGKTKALTQNAPFHGLIHGLLWLRISYDSAPVRHLERFAAILDQFCFPDGETIHAEGSEADVYPSDEAA